MNRKKNSVTCYYLGSEVPIDLIRMVVQFTDVRRWLKNSNWFDVDLINMT